jgi:hypothetical protein
VLHNKGEGSINQILDNKGYKRLDQDLDVIPDYYNRHIDNDVYILENKNDLGYIRHIQKSIPYFLSVLK